MNGLIQDVRYALRGLAKTPGFTAVAVLSLTLAIAANAVVFGVLDALILRPLPVHDPDRLFFVQRGTGRTHSFPFYRELRDRATLFDGLAGYRISALSLQSDQGSQRVWGYLATGNYFDVLGIQPALGRFFHAEDDRARGQAAYAVLSHASWRTRFGGDPGIVGRTIRIQGLRFTVLGVAPEGFRGSEVFFVPELWVPMMMQPHIEERDWLDNWATYNTSVIGRTKVGATAGQAVENLNAIGAAIDKERPAAVGRGDRTPPRFVLATPGLFGDMLRSPIESFARAVMFLAVLILLAACLNLATLFVVRSLDRMREIGIKLALGAGRGRLSREIAVEVMSLCLAGGIFGVVLATGALRYLTEWRIPVDVPIQVDVRADWGVLLFVTIAVATAGVLASVGPLWRIWRADPNAALQPSRYVSEYRIGRIGKMRVPMRDVLLAVQVACCAVLITGSIVTVRGLVRAMTTDVGMDVDRVTVIGFDLSLAGYTSARGRDFRQRLLEEASAIPGASSVAYSSSVPLYIDYSTTGVFPEQIANPSRPESQSAAYYAASPKFFATVGTQLRRGRDFTWQDDVSAPRVAIVNETLARRVGTADRTGWRLRTGCATCDPIEVIGIVEDGKYATLAEERRPVIFFPILQRETLTTMMVVRSERPQTEIASALREAIHRLDPDLPLYSVGGLDEAVAYVFVPAWAATIALSAFGMMAVMLAATGIYGLAAYSVSRRTREISIRSAIGARPSQILQSIIGRTGVLLAVGSIAGILLGLAASRVLEHVVYQATSHDPIVLVAAIAVMCGIGLGATWLPARRALHIDPVRALRDE